MFVAIDRLKSRLWITNGDQDARLTTILSSSRGVMVSLFGDLSSQNYTTKIATDDIYDDEILLPHINVTVFAELNGYTPSSDDYEILPPHDRKIRCKRYLDYSLRYQEAKYTAWYSTEDVPTDLQQAQLLVCEWMYHADKDTGMTIKSYTSGPRQVVFAGEDEKTISSKHQQLLAIIGRYKTLSL